MTDTVLTAEAPAATADIPVSAPAAGNTPTESTPATAAAADAATIVTDYEFALPDGFDAAQLNADEIKAFAKDLGLDPVADKERVQKVVDRVIKQRTDFEATSAATVAEVHASWAEQAKADKEIGGDKFEATLAAARTIIDNPKIVTPEFKQFLDETGLGNHPEAIRVFARLAPHFANDTPIPGGGGAPLADPVKGMYSASDHN